MNKIDIYWLVESVWSFAWIGGLHNNLTLNTGVEDTLASFTPNIAKNEQVKKFINDYRLRNKKDIFEMLDKFYRSHWFSVRNKKSEKTDLDIIMGRRKTLEFSVYKDLIWDKITLDT